MCELTMVGWARLGWGGRGEMLYGLRLTLSCVVFVYPLLRSCDVPPGQLALIGNYRTGCLL